MSVSGVIVTLARPHSVRSTDVPEHNADLVILGGGSGGYACALRAAELGMSVVLVERDKLGGTCLHYGCIPTKALLHAAEVADAAREGDKIGVKSSLAGIDMAGVNAYKDGVVAQLYKGLQGLVKSRKINLVDGEGRFEAPNAVDGGRRPVRRARTSCWPPAATPRRCPASRSAAGSSPATRRIRLDEVPRQRRGARRRRDRRRVRQRVHELRRRGDRRRGAAPAGAERGRVLLQAAGARVPPPQDQVQDRGEVHRRASRPTHAVTVSLESGEEIEADYLLVAVGRGPNTANAGYEEAGVTMERGFVLTDERLRTNLAERLRRRRHRARPAARPPRLRRRASSWPRRSPG